MQTVVNGVETYWDEVGSGRPIVFIHQLGGNGDVWLPLTLRLAGAARCLTYDLRGHGRSAVPPGPYTLADMADDLRALLDALGLDRASIAGLSIGGMVAQTFAVAHPERVDTLILLDTACGWPDEARAQFSARAEQAEREGLAGLVEPTGSRWFTPAFRALNQPVVERSLGTLAATDPAGYAAAARAVAGLDLCEAISRLRCPALVLVGAQDTSTSPEAARRIHASIPASELHVIPNAAHLTPVEQPDLVAAAIRRFLRATARP